MKQLQHCSYSGSVKRLLFIGAHPDDETFFAAGTFANTNSQFVEHGRRLGS